MISVQDSPDLRRILDLPRRVWGDRETQDAAAQMTAMFRTATGTQTLFPHQAISLVEALVYPGGQFDPLPVGAGKTLISFLLMRAFAIKTGALRPLLVTRASLVEKTHKEAREYRKDWVLPAIYRVESYELLSRVGAARLLEDYAPDLVILDECHALKNRSASSTRRVFRYLTDHIDVPLVAMTGSPIGTTIRDCAHIIARCLGQRSPLPINPIDVLEWSRALDVETTPGQRMDPGAIMQLARPGESAAEAVGRRIIETPGVVTMRGVTIDTPIVITSHIADHDEAQTRAMEDLRSTGVTPDGELAEDAIAVWRHARELSLGFYSVWDPRPPDDWLSARRTWHAVCRDTIATNRRDIDSAEQLAIHVSHHPDHYPEATHAFEVWRGVRDSFKPNVVERWISGETISWIVKWFDHKDRNSSIVWTDRPAFGRALSAVAGIPYYGEEGLTDLGEYIGDACGPAIASSSACGTGHNLQHFSRNLCTDIPKTPIRWEQRIGRTHRTGQTADRVVVDLLFGVSEDARAFDLACQHAANAAALTGQQQKLCSADTTRVLSPWELPTQGARWQR